MIQAGKYIISEYVYVNGVPGTPDSITANIYGTDGTNFGFFLVIVAVEAVDGVTGRYTFTFTLPELDYTGQEIELTAIPVIDGVSYPRVIWRSWGATDLGNVPSATEIRTEIDSISSQLATLLASLAASPYATPDNVVLQTITRGDSYDGTANPTLTWATTKDYTFGGWTGTMTICHRITGAVLMSASVSVESAVLLSCTLDKDDTAFPLLVSDEEFGPHPYDVQMDDGTSQITEVDKGIAIIRPDRTRA